MAVNRYDNPAQAQFIDTYVPIPFEQLYTLGKQANERVDKALADYRTAANSWAEFRSRSMKDMQTWDAETRGKVLPIIDQAAKNPEAIKSMEWQMALQSAINNVDRAKLSTLKQNAANFDEYAKQVQILMLHDKYNPLWHDRDFTNWDTTTSGLFNEVPLAYSSIKDLTNEYVNNLKDSYLGREGGFIWTGVTGQQIKDILDANRSGILSTPQAQMHMQTWMRNHPGSTEEDAANAFMQRAYTDNQEYIRKNPTVDPYAMQALKYKQALETAKLKKKGTEKESVDYPDAYKKLYNDAVVFEKRQLENSPVYSQTRFVTNKFQEAASALMAGDITPEDYNSLVKDYGKEMSDAIANDIANLFATKAGEIFPKTGVRSDKLPQYYDAATRVLNDITYPSSGMILNSYNKVKSSNEIDINLGGSVTKGYVTPDTGGLILATDFVNKIMKVPSIKYNVETTNGLERNFAEDLKSGVFKDVIKTPRGRIMSSVVDGIPQLMQRVSVRIPLQAIKNAGYDVDSFKSMVSNSMGISAETGLNVKPIDKKDYNDAYGGNVPLTGEYFTFDTMEPIDPHGMTRMTFDQEVNDIHGGSKLQNDNYEQSFTDAYDSLINSLLQ